MRFYRPLLPVRWFFREGHFRIKGKGKCICLSFDDGPDPAVTPEILKILDKYRVKAVFFCKGSEAEKYPSLVEDVRSRGHLIGNHTYSHLKGIKTSVDAYIKDVERASSSTSDSLLRPPYGKLKIRQYKKLLEKYNIFFWDVMPYDFDTSLSPKQVLEIALKKIRNGSIIVLHDRKGTSAPFMLDELLSTLTSYGYKILLPEIRSDR